MSKSFIEVVIDVLIAGGVGGLGAWILRAWEVKRHYNVEDRDFWFSHAKDEIDRLAKEIAENRNKISIRSRDLSRIRLELEAARARIAQLNQETIQLRAGLGPLVSPDQWLQPIIITNSDGEIIQASPGITILLHWLVSDLVGRNVLDIIPLRLRAAHTEGWRKFLESGSSPDYRKIYDTEALTSDGYEIPVTIRLSLWKGDPRRDDGWIIGVVLTRRYPEMPPTDSAIQRALNPPE